ncbi:MAG: class I SAM-dependent methyltransferase [Betaproteobacteria bacterium]|nr:class I SAM-dependent methyltransferase [Betaproteobacteria bacterium]
MSKLKEAPVKLEFSNKYTREHSQYYYEKHRRGIEPRLSHWRDVQLARKALKIAGEPLRVLDLPCGAGRFWPTLAENPNRTVIGADNSADMVAVATENCPKEIASRFTGMQTSAFAIDLPDGAVDSVFSMRLMHHIGKSEHRLVMLKEFHRVTKDTVIMSLWVDGNYKAWKRMRSEKHHPRGESQNRFLIPAKQIEQEFVQAGFKVVKFLDFIPYYAMWRVYVLRKV